MKFTREQKKSAYQKLNVDTQDFIMSNETTELISSLLNEEKLSGDQSESADSEILSAMYGLQTLDQAIEEISKITNKQNLSKLKSDLRNKVFDYIDELNSLPQESVVVEEQTLKNTPEVKTEQTTLVPTVLVDKQNDLPMVVTGERPFDSAQGRPKTALSFEERKRLVPNIPDNKVHYEGGVDPYREQF
jgi:hypothetical protein